MRAPLLLLPFFVGLSTLFGQVVPPHAPGEVIVRLQDGHSPASVARAYNAAHPTAPLAKVVPLGERARYACFVVGDGMQEEAMLERALRTMPGVEATSLNYLLRPTAVPNDPLFGSQWGLSAIGMEAAWDITTGGAMANGHRIVVGIVDQPVNATHPDLVANMSSHSLSLPPGGDHGTMVAGVVGAVGNNGIGIAGVNWDVELAALGGFSNLGGAIQGFEAAIALRASFNNSGGANGALVVAVNASWTMPGINCGFSDLLFTDMADLGILVVTTGNNELVDLDLAPEYPSSCSNANNIVVTSIGPEGEMPFAFGPGTVHLLAPGLDIPTTTTPPGGLYNLVEGNSFAVPHVAGAIALLYSQPCPSFAQLVMDDPVEASMRVKAAILSTVVPVPGGAAKCSTGGMLNVNGALLVLLDQCVPTCTDFLITFHPAEGEVAHAVLSGPDGNNMTTAEGPEMQGCLDEGCYQATFSAAGGTPIAGTWSVTDPENNIVVSGTSADGSFPFTLGTIVSGCTDPGASNYTPAANCDDGSCCTGGIVRVMVISADLVSEGTAQVTVTASGSTLHDGPVDVVFGYEPLFEGEYAVGTVEVCVPDGCMSITVAAGSVQPYEVAFVTIGNGALIDFLVTEGYAATLGGGGGPEVCDGLDNDCDGLVDEDFMWYIDADGDGYGDDATMQISCTPIDGAVQQGGDCDDTDPTVHPGVVLDECDGIDLNCNGVIDDLGGIWYTDADGDGFGDDATMLITCYPLPNMVQQGGDCDDSDPTVQQLLVLFILTADPGQAGSAHYVIQQGGLVIEGDLDLPLENEGVGELPVCIAHGCFTVTITPNDVALYEEAFIIVSSSPDELISFPVDEVYAGPGTAEVCDGVDNDCDGLVDEDCTTTLDLRVLMGGPYDTGSGLMADGIRTLGLVPTVEPYSGLGYAHVGSGGESTSPAVLAITGPDAIVDWVMVELRPETSPHTPALTVAALVQRDGDVVATDGVSPLQLTIAPGMYHVAVRHRNHLGCMTLAATAISNTPLSIDMSNSATPMYGTDARRNMAGTMVLWPGDASFDGVVKYTGGGNDRDGILSLIGGTIPTATVSAYHGADVNLDGQVIYTGEQNDRDRVLQTIGGAVPTQTRTEQLP